MVNINTKKKGKGKDEGRGDTKGEGLLECSMFPAELDVIYKCDLACQHLAGGSFPVWEK